MLPPLFPTSINKQMVFTFCLSDKNIAFLYHHYLVISAKLAGLKTCQNTKLNQLFILKHSKIFHVVKALTTSTAVAASGA